MADQWTAVIGRLGVPTGDGRVILPQGFTNRPLPLPLAWQRKSDEGHQDSVTVGRIDTITVDPVTGAVNAAGIMLDPAIVPEVTEVTELIRNKIVGPSMDAGACEIDWQITGGGEGTWSEDGYQEPEPYNEMLIFTSYECAGATLVSVPAFTGVSITLGNSAPALTAAGVRSSGWDSMPIADNDPAWDGQAAADRVAAWAGVDQEDAPASAWDKYAQAFLWQDPEADAATKGAYKLGVADVVDGKLTVIPKAVYAVAGVLNGARGGANIPEADQEKLRNVVGGLYKRISKALDDPSIEAPFSLAASAAPALAPLSWFDDPQLDGPTPLTITADGQVFGHCATWGTCHVGLPGCVTPPASFTQYAYFTTGATMTDGGEIPTGKLTVGGGHADGSLGFAAAAEHYDNVGTSVATVTAGEDAFGIWVAGALLPGATDEQVEALRQSPLSGDWRSIGGNLELVAAHAVNVPGFPVPRARAVVADAGQQLSLVASAQFNAGPKVPKPTGPAVLAFNPGATDLRAEMAAAGLPWPTISMSIGDRAYGPFEVAEGCVRGMFGGEAELSARAPEVHIGDTPISELATDTEAERRRARAKLALRERN